MITKFRKSPPVCLIISLLRLSIGKLRLTDVYQAKTVLMKDNSRYEIFRHISIKNDQNIAPGTVFIVRFY